MARIFQTGLEMGSGSIGDLTAFTVGTSNTRGTWSTYSMAGGGGGGGTVQFTLGAAPSEFYCGFGMYIGSIGSAQRIVQFLSPNAVNNLQIRLETTGKMQVYRGDGTAALGTPVATLASARWYFIEFYGLVHASTGKIQTKIDGVTDTPLTTGLNTRADGGAGGDTVDRFGLIDETYDDIYVNDTTGAQNTGFSGDIRISGYLPNAAGDVTGMTPTSGANYTNVDERPPNDATDIVAATGTTLYDLYNIPNTSNVATVQAVTLWLRAQKSDAGAKSIAHKIKSGSTEDTGADIALSTSWVYYKKHYNVDPTDSAAWTPSKIDNLQIGQKAR